ncbi:hypothetical protein, partial [Streptomyces sp. NPDC055140]
MTTAINHRSITTASPVKDTATADVFTATVYLNTNDFAFILGYEHRQPVTEATRPDGTPLRLIFNPSARINDHASA